MTTGAPEFLRPSTLEEAVDVFAAHADEARVIAGGQSLVPLMTLGLASPGILVSLDRCTDLGAITLHQDGLRIGANAATRRVELNPDVGDAFPLLASAAAKVGSPHVRNLGTVVGNVCHADPGGDLIPALLCHDSRLRVASGSGSRWIALGDLVVGPFMTGIADDEIAVEIRVAPEDALQRHAYRKVVKRSGDLALASCAVLLSVDDGRITDARLTVGGAVAAPVRLTGTEAALTDTTVHDVSPDLFADTVGIDLADAILPEKATPRHYLEAMFPRLAAATVTDALGPTP